RRNKTARADVVALDDHFKTECPIAMKIDVEGYESRVLQGAEAVLGDHRLKVVIGEAISRPERDSTNVIDSVEILRRHGFSICVFDCESCMLRGMQTDVVAYVSEGDENCLFIRDEDFVLSQLAVKFQEVAHSAPAEEADVAEALANQGEPNGHSQECAVVAAGSR